MAKKKRSEPAGHHVTDDEQSAIVSFTANLMQALRLEPYHVVLMAEPCGEDSIARIKCVEGRHVAQIWLCVDWMDRPEAEQMQTITHEVLHILHRHVDDVLSGDVFTSVKARDWTMIDRNYHLALEFMVDHLAFWLADTHRVQEGWDVAHGRTP